MLLSNLPASRLTIGLNLLSARGTPGKIVKIVPKEETTRHEDIEIHIQWDNGAASLVWQFQGDYITVVEP